MQEEDPNEHMVVEESITWTRWEEESKHCMVDNFLETFREEMTACMGACQ
jgi:hypothetical protein